MKVKLLVTLSGRRIKDEDGNTLIVSSPAGEVVDVPERTAKRLLENNPPQAEKVEPSPSTQQARTTSTQNKS